MCHKTSDATTNIGKNVFITRVDCRARESLEFECNIQRNKLTSVKLHESRDEVFDRQRMVLHHFIESLSTRLYSRIGDKQHLHQLGYKVGVPDVVLTADEHYQEGDDILDTRLI